MWTSSLHSRLTLIAFPPSIVYQVLQAERDQHTPCAGELSPVGRRVGGGRDGFLFCFSASSLCFLSSDGHDYAPNTLSVLEGLGEGRVWRNKSVGLSSVAELSQSSSPNVDSFPLVQRGDALGPGRIDLCSTHSPQLRSTCPTTQCLPSSILSAAAWRVCSVVVELTESSYFDPPRLGPPKAAIHPLHPWTSSSLGIPPTYVRPPSSIVHGPGKVPPARARELGGRHLRGRRRLGTHDPLVRRQKAALRAWSVKTHPVHRSMSCSSLTSRPLCQPRSGGSSLSWRRSVTPGRWSVVPVYRSVSSDLKRG